MRQQRQLENLIYINVGYNNMYILFICKKYNDYTDKNTYSDL